MPQPALRENGCIAYQPNWAKPASLRNTWSSKFLLSCEAVPSRDRQSISVGKLDISTRRPLWQSRLPVSLSCSWRRSKQTPEPSRSSSVRKRVEAAAKIGLGHRFKLALDAFVLAPRIALVESTRDQEKCIEQFSVEMTVPPFLEYRHRRVAGCACLRDE